MTATPPDLLERMRQQFDAAPYPNIPLEESPKQAYANLYTHNLITPYYFRDQKVISTEGKLILDVGCGSGYTALVLAEANPGAKIIGIDISGKSIDLARQRLSFYGFDSAEFYVMSVDELPSLGMIFDYINCDEVLYLLPDPVEGLRSMRNILRQEGIIRVNFHSSLQRKVYLQIQEFARIVGLFDISDQDERILSLRDVIKNLHPYVWAKQLGWHPGLETDDQEVLSNHLLPNDKAWTISEFFNALHQAELEFIRMVQWKTWELEDLFSDIGKLPGEVRETLTSASAEKHLHLFELLHPSNHRLLDLWCGHTHQLHTYTPVANWTNSEWDTASIHLHPQLINDDFREDIINCISHDKPFDFNNYLLRRNEPITSDSLTTACVMPLLDSSQSLDQLIQRMLKLYPINPATLQANSTEDVTALLKPRLIELEDLGYLLIQRNT
jgi:SAM-dependent methyltransferase